MVEAKPTCRYCAGLGTIADSLGERPCPCTKDSPQMTYVPLDAPLEVLRQSMEVAHMDPLGRLGVCIKRYQLLEAALVDLLAEYTAIATPEQQNRAAPTWARRIVSVIQNR